MKSDDASHLSRVMLSNFGRAAGSADITQGGSWFRAGQFCVQIKDALVRPWRQQ
ncbi:MAG: hypothetical protein ACYDHM_11420 [Acidiferrobacterales bacterium]